MKLAIVALAASMGVAYGAGPRIPARLRTQTNQRERSTEEDAMMSSFSMSLSMPTTEVDVATAVCAFCAGGMPDPDLVIPTDDQATCAMAQAYASTFDSTDPTCAMVILAEAICCPPASETAVGTIYDVGVASAEVSTLVAAVNAAGLAEALQGAGPLTIFGEFNLGGDRGAIKGVGSLRSSVHSHL
jgi:hypothetical protein